VNVIPYSFSSPKIRRSMTATYRRPRRVREGGSGRASWSRPWDVS